MDATCICFQKKQFAIAFSKRVAKNETHFRGAIERNTVREWTPISQTYSADRSNGKPHESDSVGSIRVHSYRFVVKERNRLRSRALLQRRGDVSDRKLGAFSARRFVAV